MSSFEYYQRWIKMKTLDALYLTHCSICGF